MDNNITGKGLIHKLEDGTPDDRPMLDEDLVAFLAIAANFFDNLNKSQLAGQSHLGPKMAQQLMQLTNLASRLGEEHRTMYIPYGQMVQNLFKTMGSDSASLMHAGVGVAGEAGELLDAIKKHWVYNKPLDAANVLEELGDMFFYAQWILNAFGWTWADVRMANRMKLAKRYPDGVYTDAHAQARLDKQE